MKWVFSGAPLGERLGRRRSYVSPAVPARRDVEVPAHGWPQGDRPGLAWMKSNIGGRRVRLRPTRGLLLPRRRCGQDDRVDRPARVERMTLQSANWALGCDAATDSGASHSCGCRRRRSNVSSRNDPPNAYLCTEILSRTGVSSDRRKAEVACGRFLSPWLFARWQYLSLQ